MIKNGASLKKRPGDKKYLVFVGIGFELVGLMLAALFLGSLIDDHYQTGGLGTAGLLFVGMGIWIWHLIVLTQGFMNPKDK